MLFRSNVTEAIHLLNLDLFDSQIKLPQRVPEDFLYLKSLSVRVATYLIKENRNGQDRSVTICRIRLISVQCL